ncbi:hypothetical protein EHQ58_09915 [Leptospira ognonensis]|uniref:Uncharacterized protein n=1 Tax=Leptospira ognonensis TaxID=2484945 RepID=A0A4V3JRA1_9LEPT|nr:hypothetical protein [Leptospira ognonensis]TGL59215.1 hypothetical protein EHQ58_09915 [Leptospira ognonensis]
MRQTSSKPNRELVKGKNIRSIRFGLSLFLFSTILHAENSPSEDPWIRKGRIFYEAGLAGEVVRSPSAKSNDYEKNYYRYLGATDTNFAFLGIAGIEDAQKQFSYTGNNQKLNLEYLITNWLGIGGSLQNSMITTYHLTKNDTELTSDLYGNLQSVAIYFPELTALSDFFNVYGLLPDRKKTQSLRTYDYDLTFHLPAQGNFDPYFRLSIGRGFLTEELIARSGWSGGFKWKLDTTFFLSSEVYQSRIIAKGNSGNLDDFIESGVRFGMGFYSTWPK